MKKIFVLASISILLSGCALFHHNDKVEGSDEIEFSKLAWTYGGFNGTSAKLVDAKISRLNCSGNNMSYIWETDKTESYKLLGSDALTKADLLACLFVKNSHGQYVGGKFEWISVSRTTRAFNNINGHYNGWTLSDVPNPCECAFVIVHPTKKLRTNIIKGTWKR